MNGGAAAGERRASLAPCQATRGFQKRPELIYPHGVGYNFGVGLRGLTSTSQSTLPTPWETRSTGSSPKQLEA